MCKFNTSVFRFLNSFKKRSLFIKTNIGNKNAQVNDAVTGTDPTVLLFLPGFPLAALSSNSLLRTRALQKAMGPMEEQITSQPQVSYLALPHFKVMPLPPKCVSATGNVMETPPGTRKHLPFTLLGNLDPYRIFMRFFIILD